MMNVSNNLIAQKLNSLNAVQQNNTVQTHSPVQTDRTMSSSNLLTDFLKNQALINSPVINKTNAVQNTEQVKPYKNDLRTLFTTNSAKILAIVPRIFNAKDLNGNEYIDNNELYSSTSSLSGEKWTNPDVNIKSSKNTFIRYDYK